MSFKFRISLSDSQIDVLRGIAGYVDGQSDDIVGGLRHFITTARSLKRRGLVAHKDDSSKWAVTPLGRAVLALFDASAQPAYYASPSKRVLDAGKAFRGLM